MARIRVTEDGPYEIEGAVPIAQQTIEPNERGESWDWRAGLQVWNLVEVDDPEAVALTEREAGYCPSARLVSWRSGAGGRPEPLEPDA